MPISSCSHCGLVNAIKTATVVFGVDKLHALLGGFDLGIADRITSSRRIEGTRARYRDPDAVHRSSLIARMGAEMPDLKAALPSVY